MARLFSWKTISSQQLLKDKWIDVRADVCEKPDGSIIEPFYVYRFPDYACALAITKDGKVILERMYRHGLGITGVELPGGCVDAADASPAVAIARELREETGYHFETIEYLGHISPNPTTNTNLMHMFLAKGGEFDPLQPLDAEEDVETFLVTMDELVNLLQTQQFAQSMQVTALFFALQKLGRIIVQ